MFDVLNTRSALPLDSILNEITNLDVDTEALDEKELQARYAVAGALQAYRMQLGALLTRTKSLMKDTAKGKLASLRENIVSVESEECTLD